ncbi:vesicle-associated protein 2-1-like isoform X2 [Phalaenopsis equestris]|uniref:vesicle-associated protein 2-1-like isoform X2 n=1 Tax=Phalaenopsis equestris TaxID=78828 RepID=UPI0009E51562|nr:vesicle-associated protein 2-1-like isoform X2 [Phalaenopsis equestris]
MSSGQLLSIRPEELTFEVELEKQAYCSAKVINNSEHYVAFKVKTTSPRKYLVRPTISVIQPWDTVTLQAQKELPPDLECKDKFLIQSIKLPPHLVFEDIPPDLFNKDDNKVIEECRLSVVYVPARSGIVKIEEESEDTDVRDPDMARRRRAEEALRRVREELDFTLQQNKLLQHEIEMLRSSSRSRTAASFSLRFAAIVGLIGVLIGMLLNLALYRRSAA